MTSAAVAAERLESIFTQPPTKKRIGVNDQRFCFPAEVSHDLLPARPDT